MRWKSSAGVGRLPLHRKVNRHFPVVSGPRGAQDDRRTLAVPHLQGDIGGVGQQSFEQGADGQVGDVPDVVLFRLELRTTRDHTTSQVGAVGVADDKGRCPGGPVDEFPEHGHHVVVAVDAIGGGPPHGGQVGIAPSVAVTWPDGFPRGLDIAVIDTRAVQGDQRYTGSVLDVMNDGLPDPALHARPSARSSPASEPVGSLLAPLWRPSGHPRLPRMAASNPGVPLGYACAGRAGLRNRLPDRYRLRSVTTMAANVPTSSHPTSSAMPPASPEPSATIARMAWMAPCVGR